MAQVKRIFDCDNPTAAHTHKEMRIRYGIAAEFFLALFWSSFFDVFWAGLRLDSCTVAYYLPILDSRSIASLSFLKVGIRQVVPVTPVSQDADYVPTGT